MTTVWPLKFRRQGEAILFADDAGGFFHSDDAFLDRYASDCLTADDHAFLVGNGHAFGAVNDLAYTGFAYRWAGRQGKAAATIDYVILVPTLRCNLACSYCQMSRADARMRDPECDRPAS